MKDEILEEIEAGAKAAGERPIEDVMHRGMDALEKELDPVELSRFIAELRRMKSGVSEIQSQLTRKQVYETDSQSLNVSKKVKCNI